MIHLPQTRLLAPTGPSGLLSRRQVLRWAGAAGLLSTIDGAKAAEEEELRVAFADWVLTLHPPIAEVSADFGTRFPVAATSAPGGGFEIDRFVIEALEQKSSWDAYVGVTPFAEMIALIETGTIEPWDPYLPPGLLDDLPPAVVAEGSHQGNFYVWPFLLDVVVQGWHGELVAGAGLDPDVAPATWDEYLANARRLKESGVAPFGCTYAVFAWRSLIPIAHSISTDVYAADGTFLWTSDAAVEALEIMRRMTELSHPDVTYGISGGAYSDETVFAAKQAAYYIKYQNAHLRASGAWPNPNALHLAALPFQDGGVGSTVFWNTGAVLFKYGKNKDWAARYLQALTYDQRIWRRSLAGDPATGDPAVGQLPVYESIWRDYQHAPPDWLRSAPWALDVWNGLGKAKTIHPSRLSLTQFSVAMPHYVAYLQGNVGDARTALRKAQDAVDAELERHQ
jgi:hypothetical protein